jgi:Protein of unknown function (DUF982)
MMDTKPWSELVEFEASPGTHRIIGSTDEASLYLLNHWPVEGGEVYIEARKVCLDVLAGLRTPEDARSAFIAALVEAGMAVTGDEPRRGDGQG